MKALEIFEKVQGVEHPDTAKTYSNIAFVYKNQGDYEKALGLYKKAYRIFINRLGGTHLTTKTVYENAKSAYETAGYTGNFDNWLKITESV